MTWCSMLPSAATVRRDQSTSSARGSGPAVVVAAAGWGKTTGLAAWSARRRVAWPAIDATMSRTDQLVRPLLEALAAAGAPLATSQDLDDPRGAAVALWEALDGSLEDKLVLVLDDLQEMPHDGSAARFIEVLCRHLPDRLHLPGGRLFSYLEEEVFAREPECVRELLRHLAVLQEVDLSLCRALGFEDPATMLSDLTRRGLVQFTPRPEDSWSLIRPLRDFVESGPSPEHPEDPCIREAPGDAGQVRGEWVSALAYLNRAGHHAQELTPALAWRMGLIPHALGEFGEALAVYHRARLGREDTRDEALLLSWTATAYRMTGDYGRCRELVTRASAAAERCGDPSARCAVDTVLAMLAAAEWDRAGSDGYCANALDAATSMSELPQILRIRVYRAFHLRGWGCRTWRSRRRGLPCSSARRAGTGCSAASRCRYVAPPRPRSAAWRSRSRTSMQRTTSSRASVPGTRPGPSVASETSIAFGASWHPHRRCMRRPWPSPSRPTRSRVWSPH